MKKNLTLKDIRIRTTLKPGDIGAMVHQHGTLYSREYGYGTGFEAYVAEGLAEFHQAYDPSRSRVWICEHKKKMVGSLVLVDRGDSAQLRYFLIDPAYRGVGLGKKLMKLFMKFLVEHGYRRSYLLTTYELPTAAHLYVNHGFKLTSEEPVVGVFGKPVHEQRYDLFLP